MHASKSRNDQFSETGTIQSYQFQTKNGNYFTEIKNMIWFDDLQCRFFLLHVNWE